MPGFTPVAPETKILLYRDEVVTIAKGMARDPSVVDATSRFPVATYRDWLKEAYLHHLAILPLPLMRLMRQRAEFSLPAGQHTISFFAQPPAPATFTTCGTDEQYACAIIGDMPHFCLRVVTISLDARICEFAKSEEEFIKGEATSYFKGTANAPRCFIAGTQIRVAPTPSVTTGGILIYIARPFFYESIPVDETKQNYPIGLEVEATLLVAKYVACRKFEVDGEGQAYQMLYREYTEELKNLMQMYGSQREDK